MQTHEYHAKGISIYSLVMAFEDAFRTWEGKLIPHLSEWRPINTSSMSLRPAAQGHTFQSTIHSPAWIDLVYRSRGRGLVSRKGLHNLHWDLFSMAVTQVETTLKHPGRCKTSLVGPSAGPLFPRSSVRFRQKLRSREFKSTWI